MTLSSAEIAAFATLFAAGIAATVSLMVSVLSKEQKTSEFRQQWIDALRTDVAELMAEVSMLHYLNLGLADKDDEANDRAVQERFPNLVKVRMLGARIELRLNPAEHTAMLNALNILRSSPPDIDEAELFRRLGAMVGEVQKILKTEWERVKAGEPAFVLTKRVAAGLVVLPLLVVVALAIRAW